MSTPSSSKNVRFNLSTNSTPEHNSYKSKISLSNLPKRRNSKVTISSLDQVSTRYSKQRRSRPSNFLLNGRLSKEINHNRIDAYGNEIVKGSKKHKVSFIDTISSKKIAEIVLIENSYEDYKNDKTICECSSCFIF